ncbi:MAG: NAD-dependent epimerase/dehydratase family protein [Chloroflexi bacterium]|uniref:NAD-dependent epimerase/dehydratase family protein n=1 Tax=Candidatus Flexifilum breve TaxID=3140694 RepID=UPI0031364BE8|nr:NAD-dependent epimerase/dehydratase family protein [Chloroflexota bacterium]
MSLQGEQVLVTGATGFLGGALALKLAAQGARVRALVRTPAKAEFLPPEIERFPGDVTDTAGMRRAVEGCSVVFHVAAVFNGVAPQFAVNVDGTRSVAAAAGEAGVKRLVHVSSIASYGVNYTTDVTEDMALAPGAMPYNITKAQGENVVREIAARYNLSYAIIRPSMIYGPKSGLWTEQMFRLASLNPTPWIGDGSGSAYPIYVDDVVDLLILVATHPNAHNQAFNCTPDPSPTWRDYLQSYSRLAGHDNWLAIPPLLMLAVGGIAMLVSPPLSEGRDLPDMIQFARRHITFKMTKARELLGWQPQVDLATGIARSADYLRSIGKLT